MARERPNSWQCQHHYPILVENAESGKRARCLGCSQVGSVRADAEAAMRALRDEARFRDRVGA